MKTSLTIKREGQFYISVGGSNHCGTMSEFGVKYKFKCECKVKLDKRGFLFDQVNVHNFMKGQDYTELSCENFCEKLANDLIKQIHAENPKCTIKRGKLTLSPEPYAASVTYKFKG